MILHLHLVAPPRDCGARPLTSQTEWVSPMVLALALTMAQHVAEARRGEFSYERRLQPVAEHGFLGGRRVADGDLEGIIVSLVVEQE